MTILSKLSKMWCIMLGDECFSRVSHDEFLRWYAKRLLHTFHFGTRWIGSAFRRRDGMRWTAKRETEKRVCSGRCRFYTVSSCWTFWNPFPMKLPPEGTSFQRERCFQALYGRKVAGLIWIRFAAEALRFSIAKLSRPHSKYENVRSNQPLLLISSCFRYLSPKTLESIVHIQMWMTEMEVS